MIRSYAPFDADGRQKCFPTISLPNTAGMSVTNAQARSTIDRFMTTGNSVHSAQAGTLWVLLVWCQKHKVSYRLTAHPGDTYFIEKINPLTNSVKELQ